MIQTDQQAAEELVEVSRLLTGASMNVIRDGGQSAMRICLGLVSDIEEVWADTTAYDDIHGVDNVLKNLESAKKSLGLAQKFMKITESSMNF